SLGESGCYATAAGGGGLGKGDFIAIIGIDCYNYVRDPANIGSSFDPTTSNQTCIAPANPYNWFLVEDVKWRYYASNVSVDGSDGSQLSNSRIRRNIMVHAWNWTGHSQCLHALNNHGGSFLIEGNLFDNCGWESGLLGQVTATITIAS